MAVQLLLHVSAHQRFDRQRKGFSENRFYSEMYVLWTQAGSTCNPDITKLRMAIMNANRTEEGHVYKSVLLITNKTTITLIISTKKTKKKKKIEDERNSRSSHLFN